MHRVHRPVEVPVQPVVQVEDGRGRAPAHTHTGAAATNVMSEGVMGKRRGAAAVLTQTGRQQRPQRRQRGLLRGARKHGGDTMPR